MVLFLVVTTDVLAFITLDKNKVVVNIFMLFITSIQKLR